MHAFGSSVHNHLKNAVFPFKHSACRAFVMRRYLFNETRQTHAFMIIKLLYCRSGWEPRSTLFEFLDKTSSEIFAIVKKMTLGKTYLSNDQSRQTLEYLGQGGPFGALPVSSQKCAVQHSTVH